MTTEKRNEVVNGIDLNVLKGTIKAIQDDPGLAKSRFRGRNRWVEGTRTTTTFIDFYTAKEEIKHKQKFELHADEPTLMAGQDRAPNPTEYLLNALAGCMTTSMVAHAAVRGIRIQELESQVEGDIDLRGFLGLADVPKGYTNIRIKFSVKSDESPERLKELAEFSPVFNTLIHGAKVDLQIERK